MLRDYTSAIESHKRALNIRQKVLGEDNENTTDSYYEQGLTQYMIKDNTSAKVTKASAKHQTKGTG